MTRETLRLFWRATWRYKRLLLASAAGNAIFVLTSEVIPPFIVSRIIDRLAGGGVAGMVFGDFTPYLWMFVGVCLVRLVAGRLMIQCYIRLEPNAQRDLEDLSFQKFQQHSLAFFADNFSGALVAKVNRLTGAYQRFGETVLFDLGQLVLRYLAAIIIVFFLNAQIALIFLVWTLLFCAAVIYFHHRKIRHSKAAAEAQTEVTARLADIITNTLTIRSFARSREEGEGFQRLTQRRRDLRFRMMRVSDRISLFKGIVIALLNLAVLSFSIRFALDGTISIGSIVLIQLYLSQLLNLLWNVGRFMDRVEEALADAAEMTEIIMLPHDVSDPARPERLRIHDGAIELRGVTFRYQESGNHEGLFDRLDLTIPPGQKVGLVGPSGSGKTTLTKLLLRFMDIDEGQILIDGQNIAHIMQEDLRRHVAYVPQEPLLFHRSIQDNIAYGNPQATVAEIKQAAQHAHAAEFIDGLAKGYDTTVGERGVKLSGGQRQRVAIARAMLKKAPVIILDEATSSLDSVSEKLITEALDRLMGQHTTIVIAHRLSTIRKLDRILVMSEGRIVEDGTHQQLLRQKGLYAKLWAHQSGDFLGEE